MTVTSRRSIPRCPGCSLNARPAWSTGLGVLEAAEVIVREAEHNGNIAARQLPKQVDCECARTVVQDGYIAKDWAIDCTICGGTGSVPEPRVRT